MEALTVEALTAEALVFRDISQAIHEIQSAELYNRLIILGSA